MPKQKLKSSQSLFILSKKLEPMLLLVLATEGLLKYKMGSGILSIKILIIIVASDVQ
jgi:hypothetical protein